MASVLSHFLWKTYAFRGVFLALGTVVPTVLRRVKVANQRRKPMLHISLRLNKLNTNVRK